MRYTMAPKSTGCFEIINEAGEMEFEARIHNLPRSVTLLDRTGREVASSHGRILHDEIDIRIEGQDVAKIRDVSCGLLHYPILSAFGLLEAIWRSFGWGSTLTLTRDGVPVARKDLQILRDDPVRGKDKHTTEITDGENKPFVLATLLAAEALRHA
jgi:hypothetical protein